MKNIFYKRRCPTCGKDIFYKNEITLTHALQIKTLCRSCAISGKNHYNYGKSLSLEHKKNIKNNHASLKDNYVNGFQNKKHSKETIQMETSNRIYYNVLDSSTLSSDGGQVLQLTALVDMDASDTAHIIIRQSSGTQQTDILGSASPQTFFCGHLVA